MGGVGCPPPPPVGLGVKRTRSQTLRGVGSLWGGLRAGGEMVLTACEWDSGPATHKRCFCPLASRLGGRGGGGS